MEIREIKEGLKKPGKSRKGLAEAIGKLPSTVTAMLKGERDIKAREIPVIRKYLDLNLTVPIVGSVGASDEAHFYAEGQAPAESVPAPIEAAASSDTVAVEIRGESLGPAFNGWLVYYDDVRSPLTDDLINKLCVVGLDDGRVLVKVVKKARGKGRFHLHPNASGNVINDAKVDWAARVKGIWPRT